MHTEIEEVILTGMVFKGQKSAPANSKKQVKTKAKKKAYITGSHGSDAAKMKADIRKKRASRR
ncbi:MAG: hypothetical protein LBL97_02885 [Prevotellaceae bacterium]|jgi:hypothetical protein|nr:hypothetical protein [Prevotellaceae bacterium]